MAPAFRIVERTDLRALFALEVTPAQKDARLVASNAVTLAQAGFEPGSTVWGIWDGDRAVGLTAGVDMAHPEALLDDGDDREGYYLWRLMIDQSAQGSGFGKAALAHVEGVARALGRRALYLTSEDHPEGALPFYRRQGFGPTGRIIDGEVEMVKGLVRAKSI